MVVGPQGQFSVKQNVMTGKWSIVLENCDLIQPEALSWSGGTLVKQTWTRRTEYGQTCPPLTNGATVPDSVRQAARGLVVEVPPVPIRPKPARQPTDGRRSVASRIAQGLQQIALTIFPH